MLTKATQPLVIQSPPRPQNYIDEVDVETTMALPPHQQ